MDPLCDPDNDRAMKEIVPPPHRPLAEDLLYPNKCMLFLFLLQRFSFKCSKLGVIKVTSLQGR